MSGKSFHVEVNCGAMDRIPPEALELWRRWLRFHRRLLVRLDSDLRASRSLSLEQYDVLFQLGRAGGALRMGELAAATLIAAELLHAHRRHAGLVGPRGPRRRSATTVEQCGSR